MGFKDFIVDSIKYSVQEKVTFLVFGLILIVLAFLPVDDLMDISASNLLLSNPSNLIVIIPLALITFILLMTQVGYLGKVLTDIIDGIDTIPKFEFRDIISYMKEGVKDTVLGTCYMIVPLFMIMYIPESLGDLYYILFVIAMVLLYLLLLMIQTAVLYAVIEDYKKAFNIIYIFKKSKEIGFKRLNFVLILSIIIFAIISSVTVTNNDPITTITLIAIGFILYPTLAIMDARYIGLIGREIKNKE